MALQCNTFWQKINFQYKTYIETPVIKLPEKPDIDADKDAQEQYIRELELLNISYHYGIVSENLILKAIEDSSVPKIVRKIIDKIRPSWNLERQKLHKSGREIQDMSKEIRRRINSIEQTIESLTKNEKRELNALRLILERVKERRAIRQKCIEALK